MGRPLGREARALLSQSADLASQHHDFEIYIYIHPWSPVDLLQNVDGMHQRAGSKDMIEFHGNLFSTICSKEKVKVNDMDVALNDEGDTTEPLKIPSCPQCGALIRPGVVWFGEVRASPRSLTCNL